MKLVFEAITWEIHGLFRVVEGLQDRLEMFETSRPLEPEMNFHLEMKGLKTMIIG